MTVFTEDLGVKDDFNFKIYENILTLKIFQSFAFFKYPQLQCFDYSASMHEDLKPYSLEEIEPTIFSSGV
jgi:hypothetical protein